MTSAYLIRIMKLAGHKNTKLYDLQGFNHGNMTYQSLPLLLKELQEIIKEILGRK